jgi:N-acetylglutamate synthase-like GNAT family acetyltransferase
MTFKTSIPGYTIRTAEKKDAGLILDFIKALAEYEKMSDMVSAKVEDIEKHLFSV